MKEWVLRALLSNFLREMLLVAGVMLLPLRHKQHWKKYAVVFLFLGSLLGSAANLLFLNLENGVLQLGAFPASLFYILYFSAPFLVTFCFFLICADISPWDCLYGTFCSYAIQHCYFCLTILTGLMWQSVSITKLLEEGVLFGVFLLGCYFQVAKKLPENGQYDVSQRRTLVLCGIILLLGMGLNYPLRKIPAMSQVIYTFCIAYDFLSCLFLLLLELEQRREVHLAAAAAVENRLRLQAQGQYEMSKETVEIINKKCHDLKHQIAAFQFVDSDAERAEYIRVVENSVMIYDANIKTGNKVLDTILTEKFLLCEKDDIAWTCMADGHLLDFITPVDLYTMMGNALDNAIESSVKVADPEKRNLSITVQKQQAFVFLQVENYFEHSLVLKNGLPQTTKECKQDHGFGVRSIQSLVEKYDGTMQITAEENIFSLSILFPVKDASDPANHE